MAGSYRRQLPWCFTQPRGLAAFVDEGHRQQAGLFENHRLRMRIGYPGVECVTKVRKPFRCESTLDGKGVVPELERQIRTMPARLFIPPWIVDEAVEIARARLSGWRGLFIRRG
jgi:hypothetical protein